MLFPTRAEVEEWVADALANLISQIEMLFLPLRVPAISLNLPSLPMVCTHFKKVGHLVISSFAVLSRQMAKIRGRCFLKESHKHRFGQAAVSSYLVLVLG